MFGIGTGEFIVLAIVLLIAVGPKSLPGLMKAVGRGMREFRQATEDLRNQVGLDELMNDDELRDPLGLRGGRRGGGSGQGAVRITHADRAREYPSEGVDLRHARLIGAGTVEAESGETAAQQAGPAKGEAEEGA